MAMLTPERLAQGGSEHAEQAALLQWIVTEGVRYDSRLALLFAVPNGGDYGGKQSVGARMKAEGLRSGVPDLFLPVTVGKWPGCWVEMKKRGREREKWGGLSEKQVWWHLNLRAQGYAVFTCFSWQSARAMLWAYVTGNARCEREMSEWAIGDGEWVDYEAKVSASDIQRIKAKRW